MSEHVPQHRVLVVDDNEPFLFAIGALLKALHQECCIATHGVSALKQGRDFRPDLVILDLGMPGIDGYETARIIRQTSWGRDARLVAITGRRDFANDFDAFHAEFDECHLKPITPEELTGILLKKAA